MTRKRPTAEAGASPTEAGADRSASLTGAPRRSLLRRILRDRMGLAGFVILVLLVLVAAWPSPWLPHDPYKTSLAQRLTAPVGMAGGSWDNVLGTDNLGRDLLSRMMLGTRTSLLLALFAVLISAALGISFGALAGYFGGALDALLMRLVDIQLAFPIVLLVIAVIAVVGPSLPVLVLLLGISGWAPYARLVRADVLRVKQLEFVEASRATGSGTARVLLRHVLPNVTTTIVVFGTFEVARILLLESAVSFLGLGVQPPTPSLGTMIADGRDYIYNGWWVSALPGLAIVLAVLGFNFLGDGLRDALDPTTR